MAQQDAAQGELRSVVGDPRRPVRCACGRMLPKDTRMNYVLLQQEVREDEPGWRVFLYGDPCHLSQSQEGSSEKIVRTLAMASGHETWVRDEALLPAVKYGQLPVTSPPQAQTPGGSAVPQPTTQMGYLQMSEQEAEALPDVRKLIQAASKRTAAYQALADAQPKSAGASNLMAFVAGLGSPGGPAPSKNKGASKQEEGESTLTGPMLIDLAGDRRREPTPPPGLGTAPSNLRVGKPLVASGRAPRTAQDGVKQESMLVEGSPIPVGGMPFQMDPGEWREYRSIVGEVIGAFLNEGNKGWQIHVGLSKAIDIMREKHSHEAALASMLGVAAYMSFSQVEVPRG